MSAKAASSAALRTGLEVRSERTRSRCRSSSCFCRSRCARSRSFFLRPSALETARSADDCCSSTDLLSQPLAMSVWYVNSTAGEPGFPVTQHQTGPRVRLSSRKAAYSSTTPSTSTGNPEEAPVTHLLNSGNCQGSGKPVSFLQYRNPGSCVIRTWSQNGITAI